MKGKRFYISFGKDKIAADIIGTSTPSVLCLHGGGLDANRSRFQLIRQQLATNGVSSLAFDFVGFGESSGEISAASLSSRVEQVKTIINTKHFKQPPSIIASSMSGYVAIKSAESQKIENIILIAPAIYTKKSYKVLFGPEFTKLIRRPDSWRDSDAWKTLSNYYGNLLVFEAENDQIIPHEVIDLIYDSAQRAAFKRRIVIKSATHPLIAWINKHPSHRKLIVDEILRLIYSPAS